MNVIKKKRILEYMWKMLLNDSNSLGCYCIIKLFCVIVVGGRKFKMNISLKDYFYLWIFGVNVKKIFNFLYKFMNFINYKCCMVFKK